MKINSHNEWDTIKEIIVGSAKGTLATLTWGNEKNINQKDIEKAKALAKKASPTWFYDENTDIQCEKSTLFIPHRIWC